MNIRNKSIGITLDLSVGMYPAVELDVDVDYEILNYGDNEEEDISIISMTMGNGKTRMDLSWLIPWGSVEECLKSEIRDALEMERQGDKQQAFELRRSAA